MNDKIKQIIHQLETNEISIKDIPEELQYCSDILQVERELGLRKEFNRGFDIIHNFFFVEEKIFYRNYKDELACENKRTVFDTFEKYYDYLDGNIYENSCYKYCDFTKYKNFIKMKKIDIKSLLKTEAFVIETIDDVSLDISKEELDNYYYIEDNKKIIKSWIEKFEMCKSGNDLKVTSDKYYNSELKYELDICFFFYNYIFNDVNDNIRFRAIMEYVSMGEYPSYKITNALCSIYDPEEVIKNYDYASGAKSTKYNHKRKLKIYVKLLTEGKIKFVTTCYFDNKSHYYCEETTGFKDGQGWPLVSYNRYFENFEEFIKYKNGNLKGVDISGAIDLNVDFSLYEIDKTTKLPLIAVHDLNYEIIKIYKNEKFIVLKQWKTKQGNCIKRNIFESYYFFDFVYYLKGNLSNAFLLFCDGLENLSDYSNINFLGARMTSKLCEKFKIAYNNYNIKMNLIDSFEITKTNEKENAVIELGINNTDVLAHDIDNNKFPLLQQYNAGVKKIYYITDIHLMHKLKEAKCKSEDDVRYIVESIIDNIVNEVEEILLIGGDVSSDFLVFKQFVELLNMKLNNSRYVKTKVIFILGNHELWDFDGKSFEEIVKIYKNIIEKNGMYLLQNELLYTDFNYNICQIPYDKLIKFSTQELRTQIRKARFVILGGLGFSGYNNQFNANQGVYRKIIDRTEEIIQTQKFEKLYNKIIPSICDKNTIIFTHTPLKDWSVNAEPYKNFIYVNGHNHKNEFYDDGDYRVYSDNQIGYKNQNIHLKSFWIDNRYDLFSDYKDGIYEITGNEYNDFYKGKNIQMSFYRDINILYMLKKNGYYCFISKSKSGSLNILNGGALKRLQEKDVNYYYQHMQEVISYIKSPLNKYTEIQKTLSSQIKKIGGTGKIHGCIIDIDWYNHIYVNPVDLTITAYWASDIINKNIYNDIQSLLKEQCPEIYSNYLKLIKENKNSLLVLQENNKQELGILPQKYLNTDIYMVSREIKKMQKLELNILSSWYENAIKTNDNLYKITDTDD